VVAFCILAFLVPLVFFSVSNSKLPPYILPVLVPLMALACALEREGEESAALRRHGWELLTLGGIFFFVVPFLLKTPMGLVWLFLLGAAFLLLGFWALRPKGLTAERWMAGLGAAMLLISFSAQKAVGREKSTVELIAKAPADVQWISAGYYFQNLTFLTGRRTTIVNGTGELEFGRSNLSVADQERWFRKDLKDLNPMASQLRAADPSRPVWALIDHEAWPMISPEHRGAWEVVDRTRNVFLARFR
jgi:hypothetical protein